MLEYVAFQKYLRPILDILHNTSPSATAIDGWRPALLLHVSPFFLLSETCYLRDPEFACHHRPTEDEVRHIVALANKITPIRARIEDKFIVHSWIRPTAVDCIDKPECHGRDYNKFIHGADESAHIIGAAVDFHVLNYGGFTGCSLIRQRILDGRFLDTLHLRMEDKDGDWIHLDNRGTGLFTP